MTVQFSPGAKVLYGKDFELLTYIIYRTTADSHFNARLMAALEMLPQRQQDVVQAKAVLTRCFKDGPSYATGNWIASTVLAADILKFVCDAILIDHVLSPRERRFCVHYLQPLFDFIKEWDAKTYGRFGAMTERNVDEILTRFATQGVSNIVGEFGWHPAHVLLGQIAFSGNNKDDHFIYQWWRDVVERICNTVIEHEHGAFSAFVSDGRAPLKLQTSDASTKSLTQHYVNLRTGMFEEWRKYFSDAARAAESKQSGSNTGTFDVGEDKSAATDISVTTATIATIADQEVVSQSPVDELNSLIGLGPVKAEVKKLADYLAVQKKRVEHGLPVSSQTLHFVFTGSPGTGKTTVARIIGKLLHEMGILKSTSFVECDRSDLIANYVGQTANKVTSVIDSAMDGVLFIDEAYSLVRGESVNDFGHEAVETLLKRMEDDRTRLVVIVAGYDQKMKDFIDTNPGLQSRFTRYIRFPDYAPEELGNIFERYTMKESYTLTPQFIARMAVLFAESYRQKDDSFGNARFVRNVFDQVIVAHSQRLVDSNDFSKESLTKLEEQDAPTIIGEQPDLSRLRWAANCPECNQHGHGGIRVIGQKVKGKCGHTFTFPGWHVVWPPKVTKAESTP